MNIKIVMYSICSWTKKRRKGREENRCWQEVVSVREVLLKLIEQAVQCQAQVNKNDIHKMD
jgi:hypothetical protein